MHACLPPGLRAALVLMSLACVAATRMIAQQMPTADQYVGYTNGATAFTAASQRWLLTWSKVCRIRCLTM